MSNDYPSAELINAFVDGELDSSERLEILRLSEDHDEVRARLCEARNLKDMVKSAYVDVPGVARGDRRGSGRGWRHLGRMGVAGVFLVVCGVLIGRQLPGPSISEEIAQQDPVFLDVHQLHSLQEAITARGMVSNIMLHVETNDEERLEDALLKIEDYLGKQSIGPLRTKIEIIANGRGLDLLSVAGTPFEDRVKALTDFDTVTILACQRALSQLRSAGVEIDLIPEAEYASSALDWIIKRLREGWVYVKV